MKTTIRRASTGKLVDLAGGKGSSSKIPRFDLIPRSALVKLANRLELGLERHKEKSWNAQSANKFEVENSPDFVIARVAHVIDHATKMMDKLLGLSPIDGDDDASAIMWGGTFLTQVDVANIREAIILKRTGNTE